MSKQQSIYPPAWLGIIGGGQLGMMLAQLARQFGYHVAIVEPDARCPASPYVNKHFITAYSDVSALDELARLCAVVTTEFENVPANSLKQIARNTHVYPSAAAVEIAQNRIAEKILFNKIGLTTAKFIPLNTSDDCLTIPIDFFPAILKTATLGYDGKGQKTVANVAELVNAFSELNHQQCILEQKVQLTKEVSLIIARNHHGTISYPLIENRHRQGILETSLIPAQVNSEMEKLAYEQGNNLIEALDYTGLLTIEFFITTDNKLLINEIAPRPHNSGHVTIEAAVTSQFEQQLRAVCGLPLGNTALKQPGIMLNLLGDVWLNPLINPKEILLSHPETKFHWYGKELAKTGRKMGHACITGNDIEQLTSQINALKKQLTI